MKSLKLALAVAISATAMTSFAHARDQIQVAGSSTVLPYAFIISSAKVYLPSVIMLSLKVVLILI
jgi:phosphate transport system substrate-binding protein